MLLSWKGLSVQSLAVKYFCETAHSRREHSSRRFSSTERFQEKDASEDINPKWSSFSNDSTEKVSTFTSQSARAYCNKLIPTLALSVEEFTAFDINVRFNGNESSMSIFFVPTHSWVGTRAWISYWTAWWEDPIHSELVSMMYWGTSATSLPLHSDHVVRIGKLRDPDAICTVWILWNPAWCIH